MPIKEQTGCAAGYTGLEGATLLNSTLESEAVQACTSQSPHAERRAWEGSLLIDARGVILQASRSLLAELQSPEFPNLVGNSLRGLLLQHFPSEEKHICAIEAWLQQASTSLLPVGGSSFLLTQTKGDPVQVHCSEVGENCFIAQFKTILPDAGTKRMEVFRDHLTGIGNRLCFEKALDAALLPLRDESVSHPAILFIDLDRFKAVNDTLGHATGDALLRLVSDRLTQTLRQGDEAARLGGDEFAVLLPNSPGREHMAALAARIVDLIQRPYLVEGNVINIGASIGLALAPEDGATRDELLKSADLALYHSKAMGRGVFHFFQPAMQERALERRTLELDLRKALILRQFELHYQPQVDVETEAVTSLQALLRWRHPKRGLLMPEQFLALSEELGLAVPLGEWVLKTACKEAMRWPDSVTIAVHVSPLHFETGTFARSVERALAAAQLSAKRLEVEVAESVLLRDGKAVLATLKSLRELGVRVAMDSFGTGVASLSQLVNFPFDKIKIDRSLIAMEQEDGRKRAIVRAISALGASLGISTLAEGVETAEHLAHVRSEGCQSMQGFYYSKAVPSNELQTLDPTLLQRPQHLTLEGIA